MKNESMPSTTIETFRSPKKEKTLIGDLEKVLLTGDLSKLTEQERIAYYMKVCESLNLNPLTKPFEYFEANGKLILGARKGCSEQLRNIYEVSIDGLEVEEKNNLYIVWATAKLPSGRKDVASGVVAIEGLKGKALANAMMTAETKAKNRVTLSLFGLGLLDETEIETIANSKVSPVKSNIEKDISYSTPQKNVTIKEVKNIEDIKPSAFDEAIAYIEKEDYVLSSGKYKGKTLKQAAIDDDGFDEFMKWVAKYGENGSNQIPTKDMEAIKIFLTRG